METLRNAVRMVPGRQQMEGNRRGDCYSKKESLRVLEKVCEDHAEPLYALKAGVEGLYLGSMASISAHSRKLLAARRGVTGFTIMADNVGKMVIARHNTGLANQNYYLNQTMSVMVKNRVPSAHLSDEPTCRPADVKYYPDQEDCSKMYNWMKVAVQKAVVDQVPALRSCRGYIRTPAIAYPKEARTKSVSHVLAVDDLNPSSTRGLTEVMRRYIKYVPVVSDCGEVRKKIGVMGDQGLVETCRKAVSARTGETDPKERLSAFVLTAQDFHAQKENLLIYRQEFDLMGQLQEPGSISWTKQVCNHKRADIKNKNYFANENLLHVTTLINLIAMLDTECSVNMADETDLRLSREQFEVLTEKLLQSFNLLPWLWLEASDRKTDDDQFLAVRYGKSPLSLPSQPPNQHVSLQTRCTSASCSWRGSWRSSTGTARRSRASGRTRCTGPTAFRR